MMQLVDNFFNVFGKQQAWFTRSLKMQKNQLVNLEQQTR